MGRTRVSENLNLKNRYIYILFFLFFAPWGGGD